MRKVSEHSAFICSWISVVIKVPFRVKDTQFVHPSCVLEATLLLTKWDWLWSLPKDPSFYPTSPLLPLESLQFIAAIAPVKQIRVWQYIGWGLGRLFTTDTWQLPPSLPILARNLHEHLHHNDVDLHQQLTISVLVVFPNRFYYKVNWSPEANKISLDIPCELLGNV